ncbi:MAG: hypothetical protein M1831_003688 [Alyxoria varia]|nr:MAG: hypothetical protein M1831_003688 [Alyxoria varia]
MCHITHVQQLCRTPSPGQNPSHTTSTIQQISPCRASPNPKTPCPRTTHSTTQYYAPGLCPSRTKISPQRRASIHSFEAKERADAQRRARHANIEAGRVPRGCDADRRQRMVREAGGNRDARKGAKQLEFERKGRERERQRGKALEVLEGQRGRNGKRERAVGVKERGVTVARRDRVCVVM